MDYMRLLRADGTAITDPGSPIRFTAATPGKKRDGLDTAELPWRTDRYKVNPVVTWVHDLMGNRLPIGRGEVSVVKQDAGEQIDAEVIFDVADPFAAEVDRKYRAGFLHAVSVSWDDVDEDGIPVRKSGKKAVSHDLLEIAAVPVPGDPDALAVREITALRALQAALVGLADADGTDGGTDVPDATRATVDVVVANEGAKPGGDAMDGAKPEIDADGDMREAAASAMLAAFDRELPDDERRSRYNWACVMYRWLRLAPPDWMDGDELGALDDENWQAIVAGELEVIGARVGKELSGRNMSDIQKGLEQIVAGAKVIGAVVDRASGKEPFPPEKKPPEGERVEGTWIATVTDGLERLLAQRAEG